MKKKVRTDSREEQIFPFVREDKRTKEKKEERSSLSVPGRRSAMVIGRFILLDHTDDILRSL